MANRSETLRLNCTRSIAKLEEAGTDPVIITALRSLVSQNSSTADTARRLWHDNQALRADVAGLKKIIVQCMAGREKVPDEAPAETEAAP